MGHFGIASPCTFSACLSTTISTVVSSASPEVPATGLLLLWGGSVPAAGVHPGVERVCRWDVLVAAAAGRRASGWRRRDPVGCRYGQQGDSESIGTNSALQPSLSWEQPPRCCPLLYRPWSQFPGTGLIADSTGRWYLARSVDFLHHPKVCLRETTQMGRAELANGIVPQFSPIYCQNSQISAIRCRNSQQLCRNVQHGECFPPGSQGATQRSRAKPNQRSCGEDRSEGRRNYPKGRGAILCNGVVFRQLAASYAGALNTPWSAERLMMEAGEDLSGASPMR